MYRSADHVFFVDSQGLYWYLPEGTWTNVENGVEPEIFNTRDIAICTQQPIKIVLLARLMAHHKGHILSQVVAHLQPNIWSMIEIHLVGTGFGHLVKELKPRCTVIDHGFVDRDHIGS